MQHTTKYQFNLIEPGDTFDAEPLNANARAAETQLLAREAAEKSLEQKLTAADSADKKELQTAIGAGGRTARVATGTYVGTGKAGNSGRSTLTFPFKPHIVIVGRSTSRADCFMVRPLALFFDDGSGTRRVFWEENSVSWYCNNASDQGNTLDTNYYWLAIGESL